MLAGSPSKLTISARAPVVAPTSRAFPGRSPGITGSSLPCIHPANGAIHAVGMIHRGHAIGHRVRGRCRTSSTASGPPLLRPTLRIDGGGARIRRRRPWPGSGRWDWLPTFTCQVGSLLVRGTALRPVRPRRRHGRRGVRAVGGEPGRWPVHDPRRRRGYARAPAAAGALGATVRGCAPGVARPATWCSWRAPAEPGLVALAMGADGDAEITVDDGPAPRFAIATRVGAGAGRARAGGVLSGGRSGARRRAGIGRRAAPPRMARPARGHARRHPVARADHGVGRDGRRDQPQPAVRLFLRGGARPRRRALLPGAHPGALARRRRDRARLGGAAAGRCRRCSWPIHRWRAS